MPNRWTSSCLSDFVLDFLCIHPFADGNGRLGRLLTLLLLYAAGYEVGRYISLERIIEGTKETYYEALLRSSQRWESGNHDLTPWHQYSLGVLVYAYGEFEDRVGELAKMPGAKREGKTNFSRLRVGHELVTKNRNQVTIGQS